MISGLAEFHVNWEIRLTNNKCGWYSADQDSEFDQILDCNKIILITNEQTVWSAVKQSWTQLCEDCCELVEDSWHLLSDDAVNVLNKWDHLNWQAVSLAVSKQ